MTRRLLFDQNLAPRLVDRVASEFPGSVHVRDLGLQAATDAEVLRVAVARDLIIVTKEKDFADMVTARGDGPKVLWLCGHSRPTSRFRGGLYASLASGFVATRQERIPWSAPAAGNPKPAWTSVDQPMAHALGIDDPAIQGLIVSLPRQWRSILASAHFGFLLHRFQREHRGRQARLLRRQRAGSLGRS